MVLCSLSNGMCTRTEPVPHPDSPFLEEIGQMTLALLIVSGKPGTRMPLSLPRARSLSAKLLGLFLPWCLLGLEAQCDETWPCCWAPWEASLQGPLCSDSGPLWSGGAGLKVELLETLPSPLPPAAFTSSHGPSCAWVASVLSSWLKLALALVLALALAEWEKTSR